MYKNENTHIRHTDLDFSVGWADYPAILFTLDCHHFNGTHFQFTMCDLVQRIFHFDALHVIETPIRRGTRRKINYKIISKIIEMLAGATPFSLNGRIMGFLSHANERTPPLGTWNVCTSRNQMPFVIGSNNFSVGNKMRDAPNASLLVSIAIFIGFLCVCIRAFVRRVPRSRNQKRQASNGILCCSSPAVHRGVIIIIFRNSEKET